MDNPNDDEDSIIFFKEEKDLISKGINKPSLLLY